MERGGYGYRKPREIPLQLSWSIQGGRRGRNTINKDQNNLHVDDPDSQCRLISTDFCLLGIFTDSGNRNLESRNRKGLYCKSESAQVHNVYNGCSRKNRYPLEFSRKIDTTGEENWGKKITLLFYFIQTYLKAKKSNDYFILFKHTKGITKKEKNNLCEENKFTSTVNPDLAISNSWSHLHCPISQGKL
jgi:hypothetical protein